jgi:tellurite resistance protein TehA-like permease
VQQKAAKKIKASALNIRSMMVPRGKIEGPRVWPARSGSSSTVTGTATATGPGPSWLRDFFPGYFALVMATGIVAAAARLLGYEILAWALFAVSLTAYPLLWVILLARIARFPRIVLADFASHQRGPTFLTIVAANGVLGSQFALFNTLSWLLPGLFWFSLVLWTVMVYGFLSSVTVGIAKPDLEHGLNGAWLLLVVATEAIAVLACIVAGHTNAPPPLVFTAFAYYLLGTMLYVLLSALILFRWVFRPMHPAEMGAPWWINMGAVAIATLAGAQLMALPGDDPNLLMMQRFVAPFTVLLWATSTFWIPLLVILFTWKELQRGPRGYDPDLWAVVFPLGMYAVATHDYATAAHLVFLDVIPHIVFWVALVAWVLTFIGMWGRVLRPFYSEWDRRA